MRRLRLAERRLSRAVRAGIALSLVVVVVAFGAFLERARFDEEKALRRAVEAERDELARGAAYATALAAAQSALDGNDTPGARRALQPFIPLNGARDVRGPRWHTLWRQTQGAGDSP